MTLNRPGFLVPQRTLRRWLYLFSLIFAEATLLAVCYDSDQLRELDVSWARLLLGTGIAVPCGIAMGAGLMLFGGEALGEVLGKHCSAIPTHWRRFLGLHLTSALVLFRVSAFLFPHPPSNAIHGWIGLSLWITSGLLMLFSLLPLFLPLAAWQELLERGHAKLGAGVSIGILAWLVGHGGQAGLWNALYEPTLHSVRNILSMLMPSTVLASEGIVAGTQDFSVRIGSSCSGFEGIGLAWIFVSFYLWVARDRLRFPYALWLLPFATIAIWCANVLRIVALILIGDLWSPQIALEAFHTRMGWVLFCGIALGIVAFAERSDRFRRPAAGGATRAAKHSSNDQRVVMAHLCPLFFVLATQLLGGAFAEHESDVYPASMLVGLAALWHFRLEYIQLNFEWSWPAVGAGVLVYIVWIALDTSNEETRVQSTLSILGSEQSRGVFISSAHIISTILIVPLAEEIAFRGYIMRRLISQKASRIRVGSFTLYSCLASSLLFGLSHDRWLAGTLAGLVYALVLYRKQNLAHAVLAHAVTNALLVAQAFVL